MRIPTLASLALLLTAVSNVPLRAQAGASELVPSRVPIHTAEDDPVGGPYGTWAAGATYKVSFHGDMTFVPFLGPDYPRNQPLSWRTTSFRIGATELLERGEQAERQSSEYRYEYRYRHFVEAYDVLERGLEQTFVLQERPAVGGDLVVTGRLATGMTAPRLESAHQGVVFADAEGRELVRYGEAFAVDRVGRKVAVETEQESGVVRLTVPASFLAEAVYPVVLDPLVSVTVVFSSGGLFASPPDIVYDEAGNDYMIVFTGFVSGSDRDGWAILVDHDFTGSVVAFADINASWDTPEIAVACAHQPRKYAVAFSRNFSSGAAAVRFHVHDGGDFSLRTSVSFVTAPTGSHDWRPDVGGTVLGTNGKWAMLVFQREYTGSTTWSNVVLSQIVALPVDVSGATPVPGTELPIKSSGTFGFFDTERPSVNQVASAQSPAETVWVVAFQEYWNNRGTPDDWDVIARQITSSGTQSSSVWYPKASGSETDHRMGPQIAGSRGNYGVAYTQLPVSSVGRKPQWVPRPRGTVVAFERFDWPVGGGLVRYDQVDHRVSPSMDWSVGGCSHDYASRSHWAFTTASGVAGLGYVDKVGFRGHLLERATLSRGSVNHQVIPGGLDYRRVPQFTAVWGDVSLLLPSTIKAGELAYNLPAPSSTTGPSCSPATIEWTSSRGSTAFRHIQQIGHGYTQVRVSGAAPTSTHFLLLALGTTSTNLTGTPFFEPGCWQLVPSTGPSFIGILPAALGADARWDLALPEGLGPVTVHFQDWHTNASGSALQTTERLTVELIK